MGGFRDEGRGFRGGSGNGDGYGGGGYQQNDRAPLTWEPVASFESGLVSGKISKAHGERGDMFSYVFERKGRDGRTSKFFKPGDFADLRTVISQVEAWHKADRGETQAQA